MTIEKELKERIETILWDVRNNKISLFNGVRRILDQFNSKEIEEKKRVLDAIDKLIGNEGLSLFTDDVNIFSRKQLKELKQTLYPENQEDET